MKATKVIGALVAVLMATALFGGMVHAEPPVEEAGAVDYRDRDTLMQVLTNLSSASNPVAMYQSLPQEARDAIQWAADNGSVTTHSNIGTDVLQSSTIACRRHIRELVKTDIFGGKMASFKSDTWWCRNLDTGLIHGQPDVNWSGRTYLPWSLTYRYAGLDWSNDDIFAHDRTWHHDKGRGRFDHCNLGPISVCLRAWTATIYKWHYGDGQQDWHGEETTP